MSQEELSTFSKENMDQNGENSTDPKINVVAPVSKHEDTINHAEILNSKRKEPLVKNIPVDEQPATNLPRGLTRSVATRGIKPG